MKGSLHDFLFLLLLLLIFLGTVSVLALRPILTGSVKPKNYKLNNQSNIPITPAGTYNNYGIISTP